MYHLTATSFAMLSSTISFKGVRQRGHLWRALERYGSVMEQRKGDPSATQSLFLTRNETQPPQRRRIAGKKEKAKISSTTRTGGYSSHETTSKATSRNRIAGKAEKNYLFNKADKWLFLAWHSAHGQQTLNSGNDGILHANKIHAQLALDLFVGERGDAAKMPPAKRD